MKRPKGAAFIYPTPENFICKCGGTIPYSAKPVFVFTEEDVRVFACCLENDICEDCAREKIKAIDLLKEVKDEETRGDDR
jgi:hypothetical protein